MAETSSPEARAPGLDFRQVYDEHFRFVWRTTRGLGVPAGDVADAVQEVFMVVLRRLPDFEGRGKLTSWLFSICVHVARDRRRALLARPRFAEWPERDDFADGAPGPLDEVERHEAAACLHRVLDALPEDQRIVLVLFEIEGFGGGEIAHMLGLPVPTVHSRLRIARERFRLVVGRLLPRDREPRRARKGAHG